MKLIGRIKRERREKVQQVVALLGRKRQSEMKMEKGGKIIKKIKKKEEIIFLQFQ